MAVALTALGVSVFTGPLGNATAAAARVITGKDIAKNAITSPKVADGSLGGVDIRDGSLSGNDIRNGTVGAIDLAPNAKVNAFTGPGRTNMPLGTTDTVVASVQVPAGRYAVFASATLVNVSGQQRFAWCHLSTPFADFPENRVLDNSAERMTTGTAQAVLAMSAPGPITYECRANYTVAVYTPFEATPSVTAISLTG